MKKTFYLGIDVSKQTLDYCLLHNGQVIESGKLPNLTGPIKSLINQVRKNYCTDLSELGICIEHTGIYNNHLLDVVQKLGLLIYVENANQIKKSLGVTRGKNDTVDAERIARYIWKHEDTSRPWVAPRNVLIKLKSLLVLRSRLICALKQLKTPLKEMAGYTEKSMMKYLTQNCKSAIKGVEDDLKKVNREIESTIELDDRLSEVFRYVTSVEGIGPITAAEIIVSTNEFKNINKPKKFACYSGVAPFEHSSGTSIRGKSKVSHQANKTIKSLLHMGAMCVIRMKNSELRAYYIRKVAEGKNKMSVLNAIRNKLIQRIYACVQNKKIYEKNYNFNLVKP